MLKLFNYLFIYFIKNFEILAISLLQCYQILQKTTLKSKNAHTHAPLIKQKIVRKYNNAKSTPNLIDRSAIEDIIIKNIINLFKLET